MKHILMVRHADGTEERACPKCNQVMTFHEGGYSERFESGEYDQVEDPDQWECQSCGLLIDTAEENELMMAFGAA